MSIWITQPVDQVPEITLTHWKIFEAQSPYWEGATRHFIGWNIDGEGRVSSAIQYFDPDTMQGVTRSGRIYKLSGPSIWHRDAEFVWTRWCQINHVENQRDITLEVSNEQRSE